MKSVAKLSLFAIASLCVLPLLLPWLVLRRGAGADAFFQGTSQLLSLVPFRIGTYLRAAFYVQACSDVDREVVIGFLTLLSHADTDIGKNVYIGPQSNIGSCSLGRDCLLGSGVHILSGKRQHAFADETLPLREQGGVFEKIRIGENCWIGNHATVMAGVGEHSIIAAGAVVVDEIPPRSIVAGNPARVLKSR